MKNEEKNVLLLSMSTMNVNLSESYYADLKKQAVFCGVSQLEPGTKYFLRKLQRRRAVFDKIFIVASLKSQEEKRDVTAMISSKSNVSEARLVSFKEMNAVDFYIERILQYIRGEERLLSNKPQLADFREAVKVYEESMRTLAIPSLEELYKGGENLFEIVGMQVSEDDNRESLNGEGENKETEYETEEDTIYSTVNELCNKIRAVGNDGTKVNLYLDMQGARRYETFIMNAAVKMLEMCGVMVKASVAIDFFWQNNDNGKYNRIVDTTINDRIFEMVSGMNEFIKTGRGDTLWQFWVRSKDRIPLEEEQKIIHQIRKIADAISLCNVIKFDKELRMFAGIIEDYEKCDDKLKNPLFKNFVYDLKEDYEKYHLLSGEGSARVLDQIEWCRNKKLYQQALTLVESKIPAAMVGNRILHYGSHEQLCLFLNCVVARHRGIPSYLFENRAKTKVKEGQEKFVFLKYLLDKKQKDFNGVPEVRTDGMNVSLDLITEHCRVDIEGAEKVCKLLSDYYYLASLRNDTNHAVGSNKNNVRINQLDGLLRDFVAFYKELLEEHVEIDYSKIRPLKQA